MRRRLKGADESLDSGILGEGKGSADKAILLELALLYKNLNKLTSSNYLKCKPWRTKCKSKTQNIFTFWQFKTEKAPVPLYE